MADRIYIRNASGELQPVDEQRFDSEALLQELIGNHPELLGGDQMRSNDPLRWILIRREMPIEGWAVDHLLLDQDARPTLVEVKRGDSPDNRRKVVGQMLDYAATAANVWSERNIRQVFEASHDAPEEVITELLQDDDESNIDGFWERVTTNLEANRLRLLFVSDEIPAELERVVKFLNEQTKDNIEVLAVEVKQYPGQFGSALVSKVVGQVEAKHNAQRSGARRDKLREEEVLGRCTIAGRQALLSVIDAAQKAGAETRWGKNGLTISKYSSLGGRWPYVARFNWWSEDDDTPLALVMRRPDIYPLPLELRAVLQAWIDKFNGDGFVVPFTRLARYDMGWAVTEKDLVEHLDLIASRMMDTLAEMSAL